MTSPHIPAQAQQQVEAGQQAAERRQWAPAARAFEEACRLAPRDGLSWLQLARARLNLGEIEAAEHAAQRCVALLPAHLLARKLLAECLRQLNRHEEVVQVCAGLPAEVARDEGLLMAHGDALRELRRPAEAVPLYMQALGLNPKNPLAHHRLGLTMQLLEMGAQAAICFETTVLTDADGSAGLRALALSHLVHQLAQNSDWRALPAHQARLLDQLERGSDAEILPITPFSLLAIASTPAQQLRLASLRSHQLGRGLQTLPPRPTDPAAPRLRLGYLSSDFHNHATVALLVELLELLDRERFEVFLYCHSPEDGSAEQARVRAAADHYRDVRRLGDAAVAQLMRADAIDIAIDLKGHTKDSRLQILAQRPAPLQLSYLGYPGSTGADYIDYVIGDPVVTPIAHAAHFSERIAQMPHSYQPNDSRRALPPQPARAALGLPENKLLFACFNQSYKITPQQADLWAEILRAAPDAMLWLLRWNDSVPRHLSDEMQARGVDPQRLLFSPLLSASENLARLQCADLFLDTWPCNAHTTASEALWAGVPVLTVPGDTFASRVAASLVTACGQAEFACASPEAYVKKAIALARDRATLRAAQQQLRERRLELPLFDSRRYARNFKALLLRMWARHQAGLPPTHLPADGPALAARAA